LGRLFPGIQPHRRSFSYLFSSLIINKYIIEKVDLSSDSIAWRQITMRNIKENI